MYRTRSMLPLAVAALAMSCGACGVGEEFTLKQTIHMHTGSDSRCQVDLLTYNLNEQEAFARLRTFIGYVEVRRIGVEVTNEKTDPASVATTARGNLRVGAEASSTELLLGVWEDTPIVNGTTREVAFDQAAADEFARLALQSPNDFTIRSEGCVDEVPAFFDFRVDLTLFAGP